MSNTTCLSDYKRCSIRLPMPDPTSGNTALSGSYHGKKKKAVPNFTSVEADSVGRDSSVGIETRYGLDGQGIESRWGRDFPHLSRPALGTTQPPIQSVLGLSRG